MVEMFIATFGIAIGARAAIEIYEAAYKKGVRDTRQTIKKVNKGERLK